MLVPALFQLETGTGAPTCNEVICRCFFNTSISIGRVAIASGRTTARVFAEAFENGVPVELQFTARSDGADTTCVQ